MDSPYQLKFSTAQAKRTDTQNPASGAIGPSKFKRPPNTPIPPPKSCVIFGVGFFDFEKMTFLDFFDMYLMIFDINSQYLVRFSQYLVKINQ